MRIFELRDHDFDNHVEGHARLSMVDLDAIVAIEERHFPAPRDYYGKTMPPTTTWNVKFADGTDLWVE
jgi:pyrimidine operon attenuation protein/uracil phosphoribosyltransferase